MTADTADIEDFECIPGLYRAWDFASVILPGAIYRIEDAGITQDGSALFAIYQVIITVLVH